MIAMRLIATVLLCLSLCSASLLEAQYRRSTPTSRGRSTGPGSAAAKDEPLPTFHGVFHSVANSKLYLNTEDENQLEFYVSRKTVFYDGDKKLKVDDLKSGAKVSVEAKRIVATRMDAVTVRVESEKQP